MIPRRVIGIDPSLTSTGISDGTRSEVIKTVPGDGTTAENNLRRTNEIIDGILKFIGPTIDYGLQIWLEGPMLNAQGASHLYDIGWLYSAIYREFRIRSINPHGSDFPIHEIQPTTLKKFITGNGRSKKEHRKGCTPEVLCVTCAAEAQGVTFEKDPGQDKLHAYFLVKYGSAVTNGEIAYTAPQRRGAKKRKRKATKESVDARPKRSRGNTALKRADSRRAKAK